MTLKKSLLVFLLFALHSIPSYAAQISYQYTGIWTSLPTGVFGATYVATVVFDNGGSTVANQTFVQADFVSARLVSGGYDFTMTSPDITVWTTNFTSDASGQLGGGWFDATNGTNSWHFDTQFVDESFSDTAANSGGFFQTHISNPGALATPASIPTLSEWGVIFLSLLLGLIGVSSSRRQRKH